MKCFNFKELNFKYGLFDNSLDCSYIIHLEGNTNRLNNIKKQLNKFKPTKKLFIYNNKGFKKCKKDLYIQKTNYDIIDSYLNIFQHANKNNYQNILILEDDFIFKRIILQEDIHNINKYCNLNKQKIFMLSLGLLPILYLPMDKYINKSLLTVGAHAIIYSKPMRNNLLNNRKSINYIGDWDLYQLFVIHKYFYYKPLVYQRFEETENQSNWPLLVEIKYLAIKYIQFMDFKNKPEIAFENQYKIAFVIGLLFMFSVLFGMILFYIMLKKYYLTSN